MKRLELTLMVKPTEDPEVVLYAVTDSHGNTGIIGEFPRQDGPPVNTARAILEFLGDVLGIVIRSEPQTAAPARGGNAWLN